MLATTRHERIAAARSWDRALGRTLGRAIADALVLAVSEIEVPTVRDLLRFVGEGAYDLDDPGRVDVSLGELLGRGATGPTVAALVETLASLTDAELEVALGRPLTSLLETLR
jgi:hypothetical protein